MHKKLHFQNHLERGEILHSFGYLDVRGHVALLVWLRIKWSHDTCISLNKHFLVTKSCLVASFCFEINFRSSKQTNYGGLFDVHVEAKFDPAYEHLSFDDWCPHAYLTANQNAV